MFDKRKLDAEMDEEMRSHIEMQTQENVDAGMSAEEARYAALRQFGEKATATPDIRKGARRAVHPGLSAVGGAEQQILAIQTIRPGPPVGGIEHSDFRD